MPVNEQIVTGKKYRVLKDKANALWNRISFWTSANDVEFTDSGSLQGMRLNEVVTTLANGSGVPGDTVVAFDSNETIPEGWESTTKPEDISNLETAVSSINDNLSGFKFYPTGTELVALVADDSFYTDANEKYVLASSTTGQSMIDNVTYKALASTEETHGEVGADTCSPFSQEGELLYQNSSSYSATFNIPKGVKRIILVADHAELGATVSISISGSGVIQINNIRNSSGAYTNYYTYGFYTKEIICNGDAFTLSISVSGGFPTSKAANNITIVYLG